MSRDVGRDAGSSRALADYFRGWDCYQLLLERLLASRSRQQLNWRAAPHLWPVWRLAAHIVAARVYWYNAVMGEGGAAVAPLRHLDDRSAGDAPAAVELREALRRSFELVGSCLGRWTANDLNAIFTLADGAIVTRQWIIWHVVEHDLHHGGELFLTMGMHGAPTPDRRTSARPLTI